MPVSAASSTIQAPPPEKNEARTSSGSSMPPARRSRACHAALAQFVGCARAAERWPPRGMLPLGALQPRTGAADRSVERRREHRSPARRRSAPAACPADARSSAAPPGARGSASGRRARRRARRPCVDAAARRGSKPCPDPLARRTPPAEVPGGCASAHPRIRNPRPPRAGETSADREVESGIGRRQAGVEAPALPTRCDAPAWPTRSTPEHIVVGVVLAPDPAPPRRACTGLALAARCSRRTTAAAPGSSGSTSFGPAIETEGATSTAARSRSSARGSGAVSAVKQPEPLVPRLGRAERLQGMPDRGADRSGGSADESGSGSRPSGARHCRRRTPHRPERNHQGVASGPRGPGRVRASHSSPLRTTRIAVTRGCIGSRPGARRDYLRRDTRCRDIGRFR